MTEYTASNGYTILARENATVDWWSADHRHAGIIQIITHSQVWEALREFFQHERDEELGRWRWPENPDYVVYPTTTRSLRVVRENGNGEAWWVDRGDDRAHEHCHAARAYFEAHPERKPWEDANPGEVWEIEYANGSKEAALVTTENRFRLSNGVEVDGKFVARAISARRIYPEGDAS